MSPERWQQIARLFDEVLERGPDERAAFLATACADDPGLRREVESLLDARSQAGEFLDQSALELEARHAAAAAVIPKGQHIAHFEVLALLGAGAMGEVYLARDTRLQRKVALKLLPARFTQDPSRLRRFEREARAASALSHPNIITVYEVGQDGARHYLAAEFVEGMTLRQRMAEGPLDIRTALDLASQIAAALESAHQAGIVHRDIKPENVMVRPDGVVKVLDFGIAKLTERADTGAPLSRATEQGTVIGTPGYMSPEQARGLDVDARTDIFSLGVVLYEMIAGQLPFRGTTSADAIVALLELEPARLSAHNPAVAPALERLVEKLLAKERNARYGTLAEVRDDLQSCQSTGGGIGFAWRKARHSFVMLTGATARPRASQNNRFLLTASLLSVVGVVAVGWLLYRSGRKPEVWADRAQLRFSQFISKKIGYGSGLSRPSFSPDGKQVAYSLDEEGKSHLWIKPIATMLETKITDGPWDDLAPIWSPGGRKLAFISNRDGQRGIWVLEPVGGKTGQPTLLKKLDAPNPRLIAWAKDQQDGWIYFEAQHNLFALDPVTAQIQPLTKFEKTDSDAWFSLSPDFDRAVYLDTINGEYCLSMVSLPGGEITVLLNNGSAPSRTPVWFPDGRKIAFCSNRTGTFQVYILWLADRRLEQITFNNDNYTSLALSPDGNTIAVEVAIENANLFAWNFDTHAETQHSSERGLHVLSEVSPDGNNLIFQSVNISSQQSETLFVKPTASGELAERLTTGFHGRWAPDGKAVAFLRESNSNSELWRVSLSSGTERRLASSISRASYTPLPFNLGYAEYSWSPDSTKLAYSSRKSGQSNLWQVAADGKFDDKLTDNADRRTTLYSPCWSQDGNRLAYLSTVQPSESGHSPRRRLHILQPGGVSSLFESEKVIRILGWSASGQELLIAVGLPSGSALYPEVDLLNVSATNHQAHLLGRVRNTYLNSIVQAKQRRELAFVERRDGHDNIALISIGDGKSQMLTSNLDPTLYYASLAWDATVRRLFYSKHENWHEVQLIKKTIKQMEK